MAKPATVTKFATKAEFATKREGIGVDAGGKLR
jgi:hypothetical protein